MLVSLLLLAVPCCYSLYCAQKRVSNAGLCCCLKCSYTHLCLQFLGALRLAAAYANIRPIKNKLQRFCHQCLYFFMRVTDNSAETYLQTRRQARLRQVLCVVNALFNPFTGNKNLFLKMFSVCLRSSFFTLFHQT